MRNLFVIMAIGVVLLLTGCGLYMGDSTWVPGGYSSGDSSYNNDSPTTPWDPGDWRPPADSGSNTPSTGGNSGSGNVWQPPNDDPFDDDDGSNVPLSVRSR